MSKSYKDNMPITAKKFMEEFRRYKKVPYRVVISWV